MQVRYETAQKTLVIAQQEETIQYARTQRILISIISIGSVLVLIVFFQRRKTEYQRNKAENTTRIVQQYEQLTTHKPMNLKCIYKIC